MIYWDRLKKPAAEQTALERVTLDGLVPKDHLRRKIDGVIDVSVIHDRGPGLYPAGNGRWIRHECSRRCSSAIGLRCERQLVREIEVNVRTDGHRKIAKVRRYTIGEGRRSNAPFPMPNSSTANATRVCVA